MRSFWIALLAVWSAIGIEGAVTATVDSISITNQGNYLIAADGLTAAAGTDRDAVQARAVVQWVNNGFASADAKTEYQLRLLAGATAVQITTESGKPGTIYRFTNEVAVPGASKALLRTNVFPLKPTAKLDPYTQYAVELTLLTGGKPVDSATSTEHRFFHFTNLVSGDTAFNIMGEVTSASWQKTILFDTVEDQETFRVSTGFRLIRYDEFDAARARTEIPVRLSWRLEDEDGNAVLTTPGSTNFTMEIFNYDISTPRVPNETLTSRTVEFRPRTQLDSINKRYRVVMTLSVANQPGGTLEAANSENTALVRATHFNGSLVFGDATATLDQIVGAPTFPGTPLGAAYVNVSFDGHAVFDESAKDRSFNIEGPRTFRLRADGTAILGSGSIVLPNPLFGDFFTNSNVRIRRQGITLTPNSATADLRFYLPAGFGINTNISENRVFRSQVDFPDVVLNSALEPRANVGFNATFYATTESKPLYVMGKRFEWNIAAEKFWIYPTDGTSAIAVRLFENAYLTQNAGNMVSPEMAVKRANDGFYDYLRDFTSVISVGAAPGNVAQVDFMANFIEGSFSPHFPMGTKISWDSGNFHVIANGVASDSKLQGIGAVAQRYVSSCASCDEENTISTIQMKPLNDTMTFTRDGGLVAPHAPAPAQNLNWGFSPAVNAFAHRALEVTNLSFAMPGHFLRGIDNKSTPQNGPGILHLTGVYATDVSKIERPLTPAYNLDGFADYAGINVRSEPAETSKGRDVITGVTVNFSRTGRAKYYTRMAGVSGIHEAVSGSFDNTLTMLGYPFQFTTYGFSYLDSINILSRTDGEVSVPEPSLFTLPFEELKLTCAGGLGPAKLPENTGYRHLLYWDADILPRSIRFESKPAELCDPTKGYLVLGVNAHASYVAEALSGTMGFFSNGTIIPPKFGLPGVDSRFALPSQFRFTGPPGSGDWTLTPVAPGYFTTNQPSLAPSGFMNVAGVLNTPFFENVKVHLHTGARKSDAPGTPEVRLAGGWPKAGEENIHGWKIGQSDYFNDTDFDELNRGFPDGVSAAAYTSSQNDQYRALAYRNCMDILELKYQLTWDTALRFFRSPTTTTEFFVVEAPHQLTYLDPKRVVIDIGKRYDGLPVVTLANLQVSDNNAGAANAMRAAIPVDAFDDIAEGLASADTLFSENPTALIDRFVAEGIDGLLNTLMDQLVDEWNDAKADGPQARADFEARANKLVKAYFLGDSELEIFDTVERRLQNLGRKNSGGQLFTALADRISSVADGIGVHRSNFNGGPNGVAAIRNLVNFSASEYAAAVAGPEVQAALNENSSSFQQLNSIMNSAQGGIAGFNTGLAGGTSEWAQELEAIWTASALRFGQLTTNAASELSFDVQSINWRIDDPLAGAARDEFKARLRSAITSRLLSEPSIASIRSSIKMRLFDLNENYRSAANSVFSQYNFVARELIGRMQASVDNNFTPGIGLLSEFFAVSRLQGHAEIQDDSLRELRLDARIQLKAPAEMAFNAFVEIKEQNSENTPEGCQPPPGDTGTEIKIGANDVELDWISDGLRVNVGTKINLVNNAPVGFAGSFETTGPLSFGGFVIKQVGFALAFGQFENYIAGNARVKLGQSSEIAGGLFFGRACDIDPIALAVTAVSPYLLLNVNPHQIFGEPPFTGAFVYGEGMFPVFSLGCLLEVRLIAGAGAWYFVEGPKFGGIIKAGVSGTAICVLSASGDITMIAARHESAMVFTGMAHVEGCFGFWPFEVCVDTDTSVSYVEGKEWDAEEP